MRQVEKRNKTLDSESGKLCCDPTVSSFVFALASMVFNDEFQWLLVARDWGMMLGYVVITYFGFFFFFCFVVSVLSVSKLPKAGRLAKPVVFCVAVCVFSALYYGLTVCGIREV